ncbi:glycine zipper 2TM domain-containing protein [Massilia sp. Dwa41.01b]|nr:glycine zipper 2TM domain-containing protein [Massilia sp. Dwa41.01b]
MDAFRPGPVRPAARRGSRVRGLRPCRARRTAHRTDSPAAPECRTEYVQVPVQQQRGAGGSVVGGIAGALLGSQVGGGNGKVAAAAAGAIAGAVVGDRIENNGRQYNNGVQEQAVRQCRNVDSFESRTIGYDVTYEYRGQNYTSFMNRDPGNRIRLRVSVEPDQY